MEGNFRNVLIILSAVVIGAIFVHGLWTIRKNKNPYKLKTAKDVTEPVVRGFDHSGFDQDGVSKRRIKKELDEDGSVDDLDSSTESDELSSDQRNELSQNQSYIEDEGYSPAIDSGLKLDDISELEIIDSENNIPLEQQNDQDEQAVVESFKAENHESESQEPEELSLYETPVTRPKPEVIVVKKPTIHKVKPTKAELKRNQMEINFGDELTFEDFDIDPPENTSHQSQEQSLPEFNAADEENEVKKANIDPEVIVLSVVMAENQVISGAALLPSLLTLGMKYGEMNIFHRHQDNAGNGKVTFSLANMMNPGTFDLDAMETFSTQGVSLFMTLPNAGDPFEVFNQMLSAAKQLAQEFQGQLLDDKRSMMTKQTEQHYIGKIRDFERKNRVMSS